MVYAHVVSYNENEMFMVIKACILTNKQNPGL